MIRPPGIIETLGLRGVYGTPEPGADQRAARKPSTTIRFAAAFNPDDYATTDTDGTDTDVTRVRPAKAVITGDWIADPNAVIQQALVALGAVRILDTDGVQSL